MIEPQSSDLNPWIRVASFEVYLILDRWGLSSVRDASVFLGISRHTPVSYTHLTLPTN